MGTQGDDQARARQRVGGAERNRAIEELNAHWRAGRLDPTEHEARTTRAHSATTRGDLEELFSDLPQAGDGPGPPPTPAARAAGDLAPQEEGPSRTGRLAPAGSAVGHVRDVIMGLTPFVALVLFFTRDSWLWFLLIPVVSIVLYGPDGRDGRRWNRRHR